MSLKSLRTSFKKFAFGLIEEGNMQKNSQFTKHPESLFSEGAWIQLLFLFKFWIEVPLQKASWILLSKNQFKQFLNYLIIPLLTALLILVNFFGRRILK